MSQQDFEVYLPSKDTDALVARWWCTMERDGDLAKLFYPTHQSMGALFSLVQPPNVLLYRLDAQGEIWFAAICSGFMNGVYLAAWCAQGHRHTRAVLDAFLDLWERILLKYPVVLGVTKQPKIVREHERLGYVVLGKAPALWAGEDAWFVMLTRPAFMKTLARFRRVSPALEEVT